MLGCFSEERFEKVDQSIREPLLDGLGRDRRPKQRGGPGQFLVVGLRLGQETKDKGLCQGGKRELALSQDDAMSRFHVFGHRPEQGLHGLCDFGYDSHREAPSSVPSICDTIDDG
jgi:hypothetical protein